MDNNSFLREFVLKANEHSKKLTVIDTAIYCMLMIIVLTITVIWPDLADHMQSICGYITSAYVALRTGYGAKSAIENWKKISNSITTTTMSEDDEEDTDENSLG